jgi:hypothetical protein
MLSPSELAHLLTARPCDYRSKNRIENVAKLFDSEDRFVPLLHALLERAVSCNAAAVVVQQQLYCSRQSWMQVS